MLRSYILSPLGSCGCSQRLTGTSVRAPVEPRVFLQRSRCISTCRFASRRVLSVSAKSDNTSNFADSHSASPLLPLYLSTLTCIPASASAADGITYNPGGGADVVKNVAGLAYVGLLAFWLFKVIGRRVKRSTTEVILKVDLRLAVVMSVSEGVKEKCLKLMLCMLSAEAG